MAYSQYQSAGVAPTTVECAVLQCLEVRWDGDVESKRDRSLAVDKGWIARINGFNLVTPLGVAMLLDRGLIRP